MRRHDEREAAADHPVREAQVADHPVREMEAGPPRDLPSMTN
jgi:hypothetical protein